MFIAASTRCFSDLPFAETCRLLADLEYDKLEIWLDEQSDHLKPSQVTEDPEAFANTYRELTRLTPIAFYLNHDIPTDQFSNLAKLCKLLKVTQVTVPSAQLGTPFNAEIDRLRELLAIANREAIRLSIKTESGCLTEDPQTAIELCQAVNGLGLTLDPSHYIYGHPGELYFDQVFPYVFHVHLRDTLPTQLQVQIGLGEVDYSRIIAMLRRENYMRALSVEIYPELLNGADRSLELRKLRMLLETLL